MRVCVDDGKNDWAAPACCGPRGAGAHKVADADLAGARARQLQVEADGAVAVRGYRDVAGAVHGVVAGDRDERGVAHRAARPHAARGVVRNRRRDGHLRGLPPRQKPSARAGRQPAWQEPSALAGVAGAGTRGPGLQQALAGTDPRALTSRTRFVCCCCKVCVWVFTCACFCAAPCRSACRLPRCWKGLLTAPKRPCRTRKAQ